MILNVCRVYTSATCNNAIQACKYFLRARPLNYLPYTNMLMEMITFCLQNNIFIFDGRNCDEHLFCPRFCQSLCGVVGERGVQGLLKRLNMSLYDLCSLIYFDDIFIIWKGSIE